MLAELPDKDQRLSTSSRAAAAFWAALGLPVGRRQSWARDLCRWL